MDRRLQLVVDSEQRAGTYLADLMAYRELLGFLALRDILVRYRHALFGIAWALLKPLITMLIFTLVFRNVAALSSGGVNYALFVLAGMLPYQLFAGSLAETSFSLVSHANLITKVYFPRAIIPLAQMGVHLMDFLIGLLFLMGLMLVYGEGNLLSMIFLPFFTLLCLLLSVGVGLWFSSVMVQYRDFKFIVPLIVQFGMFISPVGYASFELPEKWIWLYSLNPIVGIIDGFRWALFGIFPSHFWISVSLSLAITVLIALSGFKHFRTIEKHLADRI